MDGAFDVTSDWTWSVQAPDVHRVNGWRNITVVAWLSKPTAPAVRELAKISQQVLDASPSGTKLSYVHLVPLSLRLPDTEALSALHEITRKYGKHTACVGVVVSGSGFWASAVRSIVTGVQVLAPASVDLRIHANNGELLSWFPREHEAKTGVAISGHELLRKVDQAAARQRASMPAAMSAGNV